MDRLEIEPEWTIGESAGIGLRDTRRVGCLLQRICRRLQIAVTAAGQDIQVMEADVERLAEPRDRPSVQFRYLGKAEEMNTLSLC